MKSPWQAAAWAGGVLGAAVTGTAVGVAGFRRRAGSSSTVDEPDAESPGSSTATRTTTVETDDGVPLAVHAFDPAGNEKAECTVVFIHGFTLDSRAWCAQLSGLPSRAATTRLLTYDQRGHGCSGAASSGRTIERLAADLEAVLRAEVPTGPVVLVGHSMGGMVVMALAEHRPELFTDRVRAVALLGTSAGGLSDSGTVRPWLSRYNPVPRGLGVLAALQPELVERARHLGDGVARRVTRSLAFGRNAVPAAVVDLVADMIGTTRVGVITGFLPAFATHERTHALAALRTCAVLVLSGDCDRITPFRHAELIARALPHSRFVRAEGAGHSVMLEQPELVNAELAELLRDVSADVNEQRGGPDDTPEVLEP